MRDIFIYRDGKWFSLPGHGCYSENDFREYKRMMEGFGQKEGEHFKIEPPLP